MGTKSTVYIPTLDPRGGGGVLSVTEFTYKTACNAGYEPHLIYNAIPWEDCVTVRDLLMGNVQPRYEQFEVAGMEGTVIGRVFPEVESLNYILNRSQWDDALGDGPAFAVGGPCLPGLPLALDDRPFCCWIGTLLTDEREVQLPGFARYRQFRYQLERPLLSRLERKTLQAANRVFVQSTYTQRRVHKKYDVPKTAIEHLPFPIDTEHFTPTPATEDGFEIIFVGRFNDPRKNIKLLLQAFVKVRKTVPEATLTLIGDTPGEELSTYISELEIDASVDTPGHVSDLVSRLQQADVFVLPSQQEGLGIAGLEAMSCGLPIVSTECGGPEDYVIDGETGFLVPIDDEQALVAQLTELLMNPTQRRRLGNNARRFVEKNYAKAEITKRLTAILDGLNEDWLDR